MQAQPCDRRVPQRRGWSPGGFPLIEVLMASAGDVQIQTFSVTPATAQDGQGATCAKSLPAVLELNVGGNSPQVTASACPRRNMTY
jgi:hypothetical protein